MSLQKHWKFIRLLKVGTSGVSCLLRDRKFALCFVLFFYGYHHSMYLKVQQLEYESGTHKLSIAVPKYNISTVTKWTDINLTSRPCRTLFGYCPQPALGSRKADMKTLSFFFPTPYPCHVAGKQLSSPDIMGGRAACACALHSFLLCPEHDNGWVHWRTLLIPTNTSK